MNCAIHTEIPATAYCRNCGKPLCENCKREVGGVVYCEPCIATRMHGAAYVPGATAPPPPFVAAVRAHDAPNPGLALGLGFIPGVGAMYNGQIMKGFIHVGVFALLIAVTDHAGFFGIFIPFFVFYMAIDAYQTARAKERGEPLPDHLGLSNLIGPGEFRTSTQGAYGTAAPLVTPVAGGGGAVNTSGASPAGTVDAVAGSNAVPNPGGPLAQDQFVGTHFPTGAIVLIGMGVLFLLNNLGVLGFHGIGRLWPLFLIGVGISIVMRRRNPGPMGPR